MSIREEITHHFREGIQTGRYLPGAPLPSSQTIAEQFRTTPPNVQRALTLLVEEGLIVREPRIGTFVREKRRQLTGVAIYLPDFAHGGIFPFRRLYLRMLETELIRRGLHCRIVVDNAGGNGLQELRRLARSGAVQAVAFVDLCKENIAELIKLPIPAVGLSTNPAERHVEINSGRFRKPLARAFRQAGGRRAAAITPLDPEFIRNQPGNHGLPWIRSMVEPRFAEAGISLVHNLTFDHLIDFPPDQYDTLAYREFMEVRTLPEQPDGLLIYPDSLLPGVMTAMVKCGVDPVRDYRLVAIHRNREFPRLFPGPCLWLELSVEQMVHETVELIFRRYQGEDIRKTVIEHRLVPSSGA